MKGKSKANPVLGSIHAVATKDQGSAVLSHVLVRGNKAIATDGYICAMRDLTASGIDNPMSLEGVEALIPATVAKDMSKAKALEIEADERTVTVKDGAKTLSAQTDVPMSHFPDCERVMPRDNHGFHITLNVEFLKRLADAISSDGLVKLTFGDTNLQAVYVTGNLGEGAIMPVRD